MRGKHSQRIHRYKHHKHGKTLKRSWPHPIEKSEPRGQAGILPNPCGWPTNMASTADLMRIDVHCFKFSPTCQKIHATYRLRTPVLVLHHRHRAVRHAPPPQKITAGLTYPPDGYQPHATSSSEEDSEEINVLRPWRWRRVSRASNIQPSVRYLFGVECSRTVPISQLPAAPTRRR